MATDDGGYGTPDAPTGANGLKGPAGSTPPAAKPPAAKTTTAPKPASKPAASSPVPGPTYASPVPVDMGIEGLDAFMLAIGGAESGGNYNATNKDSGAHGKYQIMPSNWPAWSREAGIPGAPQTPANQERVARFKMAQYYRQFGSWGAVAVAWYAGPGAAAAWVKNPNAPRFTRKQGQYPSINDYVRITTGKMGSSTGGTSGATGTMSTTQALNMDDLAAQYGYVAGFFNSDPELRKLLNDAVNNPGGPWSPEEFQRRLRTTSWYKTHSNTDREWTALKARDPAGAEQQLQQMRDEVSNIARTLGVDLSQGRLNHIATTAIRFGYAPNKIADWVASELRYDPSKPPGGQAGGLIARLKAAAKAQLVPISDATLQDWARQILQGNQTEEAFNANYLVKQAKSRFSYLAEHLDAGGTVAQYFEPYRQMAAQLLEISPDAVDLADPKYLRVLDQTGADGKRTAMSLADASDYFRSLPDFRKTKQAGQQVAGMASTFLKAFGQVA